MSPTVYINFDCPQFMNFCQITCHEIYKINENIQKLEKENKKIKILRNKNNNVKTF